MLARSASLVVLLLLLVIHAASAAADADGQFVHQGFAAAGLALDGLAVVTPDGLLALTNATDQAKAHAFHPTPLHFRSETAAAARSFSTCFVFTIVSPYEELSSHGLAFVVSPTTDLSTANAGQYLGILNATNGTSTAGGRILAVELDTITDAEFHDINSNHVGIDVNSMISAQAREAGFYDDGAGGAFRELTLNSRKPMHLWVDYDGEAIDLSTVVADPVYVGFSAATGVLSTHHYVLGWSFSLDGPAPPLDFTKLPVVPRLGPKPRSKVLSVALPLATVLLVAASPAAVLVIVGRRRRYAEVREDWEEEFGPHRFAYKDLFRATDGFEDRNLLGVGGFGRVYKGTLPTSNLEVAVKKVSHGSKQGVREFVAEVVSIGRLRHRNLVQLLGYCRRRGELLLVYDYMANGSLDRFLYDRSRPVLSWHQRHWIIRGVASGLLYLHEDWEQVVVHRDVKASNVLLDHEMNGRLGDFGLARLYDHGADPQTTRVVGTMGYLAPELVRDGKATPATDVFAFGAFLLEVVCGRRPIERDGHGDPVVLADRVIERHRGGSVLDVVDPRLAGSYDAAEVTLVVNLGVVVCLHPWPDARPSMRKVVHCLDSGQPVPDVSPSYSSYSMATLMQIQGFAGSHAMSHDPSATSVGASSSTVFSQGR
ncbi:hypothetical protein HU200_054773 [Digitaria exilis]|uniref:non-specific serine/threonine protein kinase n=1 Tax=Digitaria exilis TaxID=1010633 RepID=A0A835APM7_9POAL|nr:hypothetical protein HU200_054773 [Digitaria exilis]